MRLAIERRMWVPVYFIGDARSYDMSEEHAIPDSPLMRYLSGEDGDPEAGLVEVIALCENLRAQLARPVETAEIDQLIDDLFMAIVAVGYDPGDESRKDAAIIAGQRIRAAFAALTAAGATPPADS